jgi:hypothetical protein
MADTPSFPAPLDPREHPILENLLRIRDELTLLKQDRASYVKSQDVMVLYEKVVGQVKLLNEIRADKPSEENRGLFTPLYQRRVVLIESWQWIES